MDIDEPGLPSLYEWAGGTASFRALIDAFYDRVEADAELSPFFPGGVSEEHRVHVTAWWSEVMGGPTSTPTSSAATRRCSPTTVAWRSPRSSDCAPP